MQPDRVDPDVDVDVGIDVAEALAQAIGRLGVNTEPRQVQDYLALVTATARMEAEAGALLRSAVDSARSAGATWSAVGATLGMSKQAAQKRFATGVTPGDGRLTSDERILGPVSAFDEMDELAIAGRYGWHSVEFGPWFHRVVRSHSQWEHARVSMLTRKATAMASDGWQVIGSAFPYTYMKRDLDRPALLEPDAAQ